MIYNEDEENIRASSSPTRGFLLVDHIQVYSNVIDYVEIATTGNAVDFGDMAQLQQMWVNCTCWLV